MNCSGRTRSSFGSGPKALLGDNFPITLFNCSTVISGSLSRSWVCVNLFPVSHNDPHYCSALWTLVVYPGGSGLVSNERCQYLPMISFFSLIQATFWGFWRLSRKPLVPLTRTVAADRLIYFVDPFLQTVYFEALLVLQLSPQSAPFIPTFLVFPHNVKEPESCCLL